MRSHPVPRRLSNFHSHNHRASPFETEELNIKMDPVHMAKQQAISMFETRLMWGLKDLFLSKSL